MKGLHQKQQLERFIQRERARCMNAAIACFDNAVQRIREAYEDAYQVNDDEINEEEPMAILAPATLPPKDKEEEFSSESAVSSLEDDEEDDDLDEFVDDDMNDDAEAAPKKLKTYSKREAASWIKPPAAPKRVRRTPKRFEPDVPDKATAKRDREAEQGAETLTGANARVTKEDEAELDKVYKLLEKYHKYGEWPAIKRVSKWFRIRYGDAIDMIRSALGRENAGQVSAQEIFDKICHDSLLDPEHEPIFKPRISDEPTKCCLCNERKSCHEWMVDTVNAETFPIGSTCAKLATAMTSFFAILRDGCSVDDLDDAFLRVMEAHEAKSIRKRRR